MGSLFWSINRSWNMLFDRGRNVQWLYWIGPYVLLAIVALILCIACGVACRKKKKTVLLVMTCVFGVAALGLAFLNAYFWSLKENLWMSYLLMGGIGVIFAILLTLDILAMKKENKK